MGRREDEILAEYWRTTARAPRAYPGAKTYSLGLDVLGALPIRRIATPPPASIPPKASIPVPAPKAPVVVPGPAVPRSTPAPPPATTAKQFVPLPVSIPPKPTTAVTTQTGLPVAKQLSKAVAAKANSAQSKAQMAAAHAMSTAGKLTKYHPQMSSALKTLSASASKLSAQLATLQANLPAAVTTPTTKATPPIKSGPASVMGDSTTDSAVDAGATATAATAVSTDLAASAGDIAVQVLPVIDQLKQKGDATSMSLAQEGQSIVDLCNRIVQEGLTEASNMQGAGAMGDVIKQLHRAM